MKINIIIWNRNMEELGLTIYKYKIVLYQG